jgi:hypothetical protein
MPIKSLIDFDIERRICMEHKVKDVVKVIALNDKNYEQDGLIVEIDESNEEYKLRFKDEEGHNFYGWYKKDEVI